MSERKYSSQNVRQSLRSLGFQRWFVEEFSLDPRRKKAVVLSTLPACLSGVMVPLLTHFHSSRYLPLIIGGTLFLLATPLVLAIGEIYKLKRDGNPY